MREEGREGGREGGWAQTKTIESVATLLTVVVGTYLQGAVFHV